MATTFQDLDPFSGQVVADVPAGGADEARQAVEAAAAAFPVVVASRSRPTGSASS